MEIEQFSATARELLEELGYTIYTLHGKSLRTLHAETGQPILEDLEWNEFIDGEWIQLREPGYFWSEVAWATEVAINRDSPILPESSDKSYKEHQRMVAEFSEKTSKQVPGTKAIIGTASYYVELTLIHYKATGMPLFEYDVRLVTINEYKNKYFVTNGEYLVQIGRSKKGLHCWKYWLGTWGRYDVWLMPLVVPRG